METIGKYEVHELSSKLPRMTDEEFQELKESIKSQGLLHPIIVTNDRIKIVDGINRARVCEELKIEPEVITISQYLSQSINRRIATKKAHDDEMTGLIKAEEEGTNEETIEPFIIMQNVIRRHLTDWQKYKQLTAIKGKPKHGGTNKYNKDEEPKIDSSSLNDIADTLKIGKSKVKQLITIDAKAPEEIKEKLANDEISVNKAYEMISENKPKAKPKQKIKKKDWFEENIEDENIRFIWREAIKIKSKIENKIGLIYMAEFYEIIKKIDKSNYKVLWETQHGF